MLLVHEDFDFDIPLIQPDGAHDLEAPQMRTEQDTALATGHAVLEYVEPPYLDVEVAALSGEKIDTIQERRRETILLSVQILETDRASKRSNQIGSDGTARVARKHDVIHTDRIEQGARSRTPDG